MSFEVLKFQLDLTKRKFRATSLFLHQSLKQHLERNQQNVEEKSDGDENTEIVRKTIVYIRESDKVFKLWCQATKQQFPHLEEYANSACSLHYDILNLRSDKAPLINKPIPDFWRVLYLHLLELTFTYPHFYAKPTMELEEAVEKIQKSLDDFLAKQILLEYEKPSLTSDDLIQLEDEFEKREETKQEEPPKTLRVSLTGTS